jgi:hypothetical protein
VRAAIVLRHDLDVLVLLASLEFTFEAEVGRMDAVVEVRQVVFARPAFDFVRVAIRSSIAVRAAAIPLLEPLLILALELVFEHDAPDLRALVAEPLFFAQVCAIDLNIMRQLTRPAHAGVKGLLSRTVAVATMGFQEVVAACGQRQGALARVERRETHQPFISQVTQVRQVAFGHHPKRSDGRKRPALVAFEFVPVFATHHDLPFESAGQFEPFEKYVSRIVISFASVPIAVTNVATVERIVLFATRPRLMPQVYPRYLDVVDVITAIAGIEVDHGCSRR